MKVHFDAVRIGKQRKNFTEEIILHQNYRMLKEMVRREFAGTKNENPNETIHLTIVIPKKGVDSKIALENHLSSDCKRTLLSKFEKAIYKGSNSTLLKYSNNLPLFSVSAINFETEQRAGNNKG